MTATELPADHETRVRVSQVGLDQTLFVEAGAGTGKTSQLVERIVNLVLTRGVPLERIAAITFTEAAAAELRSRIRVAFEKRAAGADDADESTRCQAALADLDRAALSTLHGFASRLLGEFAIDAGLPPRVRVLDEVSSQLAHEERWNHFVDRLFDDPRHEPLLLRASLLGIAFEPRYPGHATLKDVAAELNDHWDRLAPLVADVAALPAELPTLDFGEFDRAVAALAVLPDQCDDPDDTLCRLLVDRLIDETASVAAISDPDRKLAALAQRPKWSSGKRGRKNLWSDVQAARALVDEVEERAAEIVAVAADDVLRRLVALIAAEVLDAAEARRRDGGLEFHDLLVLARELLRTSEPARRRLHERYTHILLDEFQDTDPLQIELAVLIAASIGDTAPGTWTEVSVEEGRLFFVGDPKQSIYRFRRADIGLFLRARDHFGSDGSRAQLTTNFRTVAPVIDWVNALFGSLMAEEKPGSQPRYEPLHAARQPSPCGDHRPVLLGGVHADPKVRADELRRAEARDVAAVIHDIRTRPEAWPVQDDPGSEWRPARLADVTILVPTRTSLPFLREHLDAAHIPYRLATGTLVYDTQEVRDALATLAAIDDPSDQLSLVAALRSPLFACSDVDLFTYRHAGGRWDLRSDPPEGLTAEQPVVAALGALRALWEERWWLSPSAVLDRVLRERQAFLLAYGDRRPTEVWRRLRFLLDQARAFEEAGGGDLRSFLAWAELQGADSARVHEPLLPETDDDAVQILTIHGAKGLEFPITILSGLTTQPGGRRSGVGILWGDDGPPEVRLRKGLATANHEPRADLELEMDRDEKLRLLYVAATRARDHLVVSTHRKDGKTDTYAGTVAAFFEDREDLVRPLDLPELGPDALELADDEEVTPTGDAPPADDRDAWLDARRALLEPQRRARTVSATAVARSVAGVLADGDEGADDLAAALAGEVDPAADDDTVETPDPADDGGRVIVRRQGRTGSAIGRAVHATLQVLDLTAPTDVDAQVARQCQIEAIPELADTAVALVRSALESETVALARRHPHHKEIYVAAPLGGRTVEGYIDLLIETPEGLVVVDYKTDSARSESEIDARLAAYRLQGASYAVALEEATGLPVVECRFVFCRPSGAVERTVADLAAATEQVRSLVARPAAP